MISTTFIMDSGGIAETAVKEALLPLVKTLFTQKADPALAKALDKILHELFAVQRMDENGEPVNDIRLISYDMSYARAREQGIDYNENNTPDVEEFYHMIPTQNLASVIGEENMYYFAFNLYGDPMKNAVLLNDYIQMVKEQTGAPQVSLAAVSLGGSVMTAFSELYTDTRDVDKIINAAALLDGTSPVSDVFQKNLNLSGEFLYNQLLPAVMGNEPGNAALGNLLNLLLRAFPYDALVNGILNPAFDSAIDAIFKFCPQWWALMRTGDYAKVAEKYLPAEEYPVLRSKIDAFFAARRNYGQNVAVMRGNGIEINNIAAYGLAYDEYQPILAIAGSNGIVNSDGLIDVESATFGATAVSPRTQLPAEYREKKNPAYPAYSYISPDRSVDLSTCLLPDNTWLFAKTVHEFIGGNTAAMNLITKLLTTDGMNVHTDPENYPQYGGPADDRALKRTLLPGARAALESYYAGENAYGLPLQAVQELEALIAESETLRWLTVNDEAALDALTKKLQTVLEQYGVIQKPAESSPVLPYLDVFMDSLNAFVSNQIGNMGYSDFLRTRF
jgi:pimeloyl-ACP methyl ester carboxylesterase